jgi:glycosyltransferase involved in cell wall biosynthesis
MAASVFAASDHFAFFIACFAFFIGPRFMPPSPTVSIVMPVYNTAGYLPETLDSLLAQTFTDFELLILDDGSTDETPAVLKRYAERDARIRVISRPNKGIIASRNELLAECRGKYMAANDADDLSVPTRLEKQVAFMEKHPECVLLGSRVVEMDPYGSPVFVTQQPLEHDAIEKQLLSNLGGWAIVQSSMICRTEAARQVGGYDMSLGHPCFSEDHDFFVRLAEVGKVANLPEPLVWYRRHYSSTTRTYYLKKLAQHAEGKERVLRGGFKRRGLPFPQDWKFTPITAPPRDEQARRWGWAAIKNGNIDVARKHAWTAVKKSWWKPASWKLLMTSLRKSTGAHGRVFPLSPVLGREG